MVTGVVARMDFEHDLLETAVLVHRDQ